MTLQHDRSTTGSKHPSPKCTPRLRLKPKAPTTGYVDGAWWPRSDDLATELPDLLAVLSVRLGPVDRVIYNLTEWAKAPAKLAHGGRTVRLAGYNWQPVDTIEVTGVSRNKLVLLVVPPRTNHEHAHDAMMAAAAPKDISTVHHLLHA